MSAIAFSALLWCPAHAATFTVDPAHTYPNFNLKRLFSTIHGQFSRTSGTFELDRNARTAAVDITIDATSVYTGHRKRDDHLRSPDFLNAAEFPEITFRSTSVTWSGDTPATVNGDLTLLGVSKSVTLTITDMRCGNHPFAGKPACGFDATATIMRSDFGIKYGIPGLADQMNLVIEVEGIQN